MTLNLKSAPAVLDVEAQRDEYLTTIGYGRLNPEEILAQAGTRPVVFIVVEVVPKVGRTGLLEERGDWVHAAWSRILEEMPSLQGCRMLWNSFFFMAQTTDIDEMETAFRRILLPLRQPDLESRCILSMAEGTPQEKGRFLYGELDHDLTDGGVGFKPRFERRLVDGVRQTENDSRF